MGRIVKNRPWPAFCWDCGHIIEGRVYSKQTKCSGFHKTRHYHLKCAIMLNLIEDEEVKH